MNISGGALTTGVALSVDDGGSTGITSGSLIRAATATTGAVATSGVFSFIGTGAYTSGASTVGLFHVAGAATVSGTIMSILGGAQTTGIALNITDPSTGMTSGSLLRTISATTGAVATNGVVSFQASGAFTSTSNAGFVSVLANSTVTGTVANISATSATTGTLLFLKATAATLTTGRYWSCNDCTAEVFGVGTNGHLISIGTAAAPSIAVTTQNGITAAALTAGATDTCGIITTTGTNNNGGATVLTITFGKTYTTAPKACIVLGANAAGSKNSVTLAQGVYATTTATTAIITIPSDASAAATPSYQYFIIA